MKRIFLILPLLAACSQEPTEPSVATGTFVGEGRDRLCIAGVPGAYRAGLIAYGQGDSNCSASGRLEPAGASWVLVPKGEGDCRIPVEMDGDSVRIGQPPAACAYYCGPGALLAGKGFNRADMGAKAVDIAGDPLC
jgi:hypothetical protein